MGCAGSARKEPQSNNMVVIYLETCVVWLILIGTVSLHLSGIHTRQILRNHYLEPDLMCYFPSHFSRNASAQSLISQGGARRQMPLFKFSFVCTRNQHNSFLLEGSSRTVVGTLHPSLSILPDFHSMTKFSSTARGAREKKCRTPVCLLFQLCCNLLKQ